MSGRRIGLSAKATIDRVVAPSPLRRSRSLVAASAPAPMEAAMCGGHPISGIAGTRRLFLVALQRLNSSAVSDAAI